MSGAQSVKELRELSGAGMMDCKRALQEADGDLEKAMEKENDEYNRIIAFGEAIEKVLRKGKVKQASLSKDKKEALEAYRKEDDQFDVYKDAVLYPWQEELMKHMIPTDRQVIWVVGEKTDEVDDIETAISQ